MNCKHEVFKTEAKVFRLTEEEGSEVTGYTCDFSVHCMQCGTQFQFIGVPGGVSPVQPMASADNLTLRIPIKPSVNEPVKPTAN